MCGEFCFIFLFGTIIFLVSGAKKHGAYCSAKTRHFLKKYAPNQKSFGAIFLQFRRVFLSLFGARLWAEGVCLIAFVPHAQSSDRVGQGACPSVSIPFLVGNKVCRYAVGCLFGVGCCGFWGQFLIFVNAMSKNKTYTEAMTRLEEIVRIIEHDSPDVDELTQLAEEAIALIGFCKEKLTVADKQIEELMAKLS